MEIIRRMQCGQSLASIIEFKAVNYVFGKKEIKEHPRNARNCLEMCRISSSRGAEFFGTCKSLVQLSNNTLPWKQASRNNYTRKYGSLSHKAEVLLSFQVPKSKSIKQVNETHLSEMEDRTTTMIQHSQTFTLGIK